jgi:hypothetical protein
MRRTQRVCAWRLRAWLRLDLLGASAAARTPQHRDPGGNVFAGRGFGVVVGKRREAKLHELVVPGRDADVAVLGFCAISRQMKRRALEARPLGRVVDG